MVDQTGIKFTPFANNHKVHHSIWYAFTICTHSLFLLLIDLQINVFSLEYTNAIHLSCFPRHEFRNAPTFFLNAEAF